MDFITVAGMSLSTCRDFGAPLPYDQNSLLNTLWNVLPNDRPAANVYPQRCGITIGNGGIIQSVGTGGVLLNTDGPRSRKFTNLYSPIPFIVRPLSSDLTPAQREKYSGRTVVQVTGISYAVYWVLNVDFSQALLSRQIQTIVNGKVTGAQDYTNQSTDLQPTMPVVSSANLNQVNNTYVTTTLPVPISLTASDCQEIVNACKILYGDQAYATIREMGVVAGVKKAITLSDSSQFKELMVAQIVSVHTGVKLDVNESGQDLTFTINGGSPMPLTMLSAVPTSV